MKTFIVSVLAVSIMFSSSTAALAATKNKHWRNQFTSSKQKLALHTAPQRQKAAAPTTSTSKPVATTPAPTPTTAPLGAQCSTGWYVTGYFTPVESDYTGATETITVQKKQYTFTSSFLKEVKMEGWGKTHLGNYIGHYDDAWHFANAALDAHDKPLATDAIAIDPTLISFGTKLSITTLSEGFGSRTFTATDIGTGVTGKHIDVFTGEGKAAEAMTYKITGKNNTICTI